jgi:uncharacterized membrane protein YcaP (DUF421 family)
MNDYQGFSLERMFLGDFSWAMTGEIAFRTVFMYLVAVALIRFIGKRGMGQITPFEFIVVIAVGSATGDSMFHTEVPLLHGVIVLALIVLLQKGLVTLTERSAAAQHFVDSVPALLIENGILREDVAHREGLASDELMMQLRQHGIRNVGQVQYAWLEPSGGISVFRSDSPVRPAQSTFPSEPAHTERRSSRDLGADPG